MYGINQKPVPDDKYDDYNYLLGHWAEGMFNWLTANAKPGIFELYDDSVDGLKIRRKIRRPRARRDQLYKDEATTDRLVLDVFVHHPSATHVALNIVPGGDGRAKLKVIGPNDRILDEINIPKNHLWIKQSEWNEREKERKKVEDALRRRNAVRAGLGRRAAGAGGVYEDQINTESRGNIPNGASLSNRNLFFVGHSTEENIADITVSNLEGLGLSTKKEGLYTPKAILKAEGTIPTNVYGQRTVTVRTRTEGGYEASQNVTLTFGLPKPRITTSNRDLLEKANTRPTVRAELPGPVDTKNIPSGTKLRMYLVKGGYDNSSDPNHIFADGYTIVAETDVGNDGRAVFNDSKYVLGQIDTENLKVVAALVSSTSGTPLEGLKSALSSDSVRATEPLGREAAKEALEQAAEDKKRQIDQNPDLIETEKQAAKQKVQEALDAAKETLKQATDANGVDGARDGGTTAINKVPQEGPTKQAAKEALEQAAEDKKRQIDQNPDLIETEKQAAKQKVQEALDAAKETLKQATDANGVDGARDGGTTAINKVPQEGPTKQAAKEALEQAAEDKKRQIDQNPDQSGTGPVTPPSTTRSRRTPPRRSRRSVGFVGNSQTGTTPSAVDKSELQSLVDDLEHRLQDLADLSPEALEEAQSILREAQVALANDSLTAQELAELLAKVRQALNSIQAGTSADKSPSTSNSNKEAESAKEPTNATDVPLYGVFGAAVLSLLGALLFAVARKKNSQLDKLSRELDQLLVELEASGKDKKGLGKAKKLAKRARTFVDSQQKDLQKEAELISEIKTILSQLKEGV
ncbi:surface anchored protein [Streptococcus pneumoniae]|nr:surface anchored protein [Streptococcus pneumoniae]